MTHQRRFLAGLAAVPLSAAAGRGQDTSALTAGSLVSVPCPDPIPARDHQSGSIGRIPINDLVDACSQLDRVDWRHQLYSILTNKPDACARYRQTR